MPRRGVIAAVTFKPRKASTGTDIAVEDEIEQIIIQIDQDTDVSSDEEYNVVEDTAGMNAEIRQEEKPLTPPERRARP